MASEAEFVEAFGEDADYVDVPEDVLEGESFLDKCLRSCTRHSARKISVVWRDQTLLPNRRYFPGPLRCRECARVRVRSPIRK